MMNRKETHEIVARICGNLTRAINIAFDTKDALILRSGVDVVMAGIGIQADEIEKLEALIKSNQEHHDARVSELLAANNVEVERRREAEKRADQYAEQIGASVGENTKLRAALAVSKDPCVYCQLPEEEMAKCRSGFPGCARMDDITGCREFGAMMQLDDFANQVHCLIFSMAERGTTGDDPWWGQDWLGVRKELEAMGRNCDPNKVAEPE